jgi:ferric-dicitrate binding protein FerR (iron transport regulator)
MEELMGRYLAGDLSKEERTSFESRLTTDESVSEEFEAYMNVWDLTHDAIANDEFDTDKARKVVEKQTLGETKVIAITPNRSFSVLKIAATVTILAIATYFITTSLKTDQVQSEKISVLSEQNLKEVALPDGSKVRMNANSAITYNTGFGKTNRNVTLIGEADFDVMSNKDLPFVIDAGASRIEVLGTKFDLSAYSHKDVLLNVTEGRVAFAPKAQIDKGAIVLKGQKAILTVENNQIDVSEINNSNFNGWWTRTLVYEKTKLTEVLTDLEKTYWVEFEYDKNVIGDCPLTSTFKDQSIDDIVEIILANYPGMKSTKTEENKIKLFGKGCSE